MMIVAENRTASGVGLAGPVLNEEMPTVMALRTLQSVVSEVLDNKNFSVYAQTDMRVLDELREKLAYDPGDLVAAKWLRQLALSWSTRLRGLYPRQFRRLFVLLDNILMRPSGS